MRCGSPWERPTLSLLSPDDYENGTFRATKVGNSHQGELDSTNAMICLKCTTDTEWPTARGRSPRSSRKDPRGTASLLC